MSKNCIFCNNTKKSAEHVFPSSFGGRLTNKHIYCPEHNNKLGKYVQCLDSQIGGLNTLFGIHPDRGEAKDLLVFNNQSQEYFNLDINHNLSYSLEKNIDQNKLIQNESYTFNASSKDDVLNYLNKIKKKYPNMDIKLIQQGKLQQEFIDNTLSFTITFGGNDFFKSTLYLLITFLAHYDRQSLEDLDLGYFRKILLDESSTSKSNNIFDIVSLSSFPNYLREEHDEEPCHSIAFIKNENILYGIISFFNTVTYTLKLGTFTNQFENFVTYIYPLNTSRNPKDSMKKEPLSSEIDILFNPDKHSENIESLIHNKDGKLINLLLKKTNNFLINKDNKELLKEIKACSNITDMKNIFIKKSQLIYNLFCEFKAHHNGDCAHPLAIYIDMLLNKKENAFFKNLKESNHIGIESLIEELINVTTLDYIINACCEALAEYYFENNNYDNNILFKIHEISLKTLSKHMIILIDICNKLKA